MILVQCKAIWESPADDPDANSFIDFVRHIPTKHETKAEIVHGKLFITFVWSERRGDVEAKPGAVRKRQRRRDAKR